MQLLGKEQGYTAGSFPLPVFWEVGGLCSGSGVSVFKFYRSKFGFLFND
jgi:hypothetical protein